MTSTAGAAYARSIWARPTLNWPPGTQTTVRDTQATVRAGSGIRPSTVTPGCLVTVCSGTLTDSASILRSISTAEALCMGVAIIALDSASVAALPRAEGSLGAPQPAQDSAAVAVVDSTAVAVVTVGAAGKC